MSNGRWSDDKLSEFHQEFRETVIESDARWTKILSAFPNEDPLKHRLYHESALRAAEAQERFWNELRLDVAKKSAWGVMMLLVGLLIVGLTTKAGFLGLVNLSK